MPGPTNRLLIEAPEAAAFDVPETPQLPELGTSD